MNSTLSIPLEHPVSTDCEPKYVSLPVTWIRRDGNTQGRVSVDPDIVQEYAAMMREGTRFPPIRVWFDGTNHWLADGFQRLAASVSLGLTEVAAEVLHGSMSDAQWDSYSANGIHGLRRSRADLESIVTRALAHPKGRLMSTNQIAQHLSLPEATVRRWRTRLSSPQEIGSTRIATRRGTTYRIDTAKIGKVAREPLDRTKSKAELCQELLEMKDRGSPEVRRLLNVIRNWLLRGASSSQSLFAIEALVKEWKR